MTWSARSLAALCGLLAALLLSPRAARAASPVVVELVREAKAHEGGGDDAKAAARYTEAIKLDPTYGPAYLGLGSLRERAGDLREAERIYDIALSRIPSLSEALARRAVVRRALGRTDSAIQDLEAFEQATSERSALEKIAAWHRKDGQPPRELAVRRRQFWTSRDDAERVTAARWIRALQIVTAEADPVGEPAEPTWTRAMLRAVERLNLDRATQRLRAGPARPKPGPRR